MNTYEEAMEVYNKLPYYEKQFVSPKKDSIYRYVIKNKAFIDIIPYHDLKEFGFINIAILPEYRKKGLTKILVDKVIEDCKLLKKLIWKCKVTNDKSYKSALFNKFKLVSKNNDELILEREL